MVDLFLDAVNRDGERWPLRIRVDRGVVDHCHVHNLALRRLANSSSDRLLNNLKPSKP